MYLVFSLGGPPSSPSPSFPHHLVLRDLIPISGAYLHHGMSQAQKDKVVAMATEGEIQLLLLSPEAVVYGKLVFL